LGGYAPYFDSFTIEDEDVYLYVTLLLPTYSATFMVTDQITTLPIENAEISIASQTLHTNAEGIAVIEGLDSDYYPYTISATGYYSNIGNQVNLTENNQVIEIELVPIEETVKEIVNQVVIYPNPVKHKVNVLINCNLKIVKYSISDVSGRIIQSGELLDNSIDISNLENGIYYVNLFNKELSCVRKIIKK